MHMDQELEQPDWRRSFWVFFKAKLENKPLTIVGSVIKKGFLICY